MNAHSRNQQETNPFVDPPGPQSLCGRHETTNQQELKHNQRKGQDTGQSSHDVDGVSPGNQRAKGRCQRGRKQKAQKSGPCQQGPKPAC